MRPAGYSGSSSAMRALSAAGVAHHRGRRDALRAPLEVRLDDQWRAKVGRREPLEGGDVGETRGGQAGLRHQKLGETLVARNGRRLRVRAGEGHAELLEKIGIEGLASPAEAPGCRVEDEIRGGGLEAGHQAGGWTRDFEGFDLVPEPGQRGGQRGDGLRRVEVGLFFAMQDPEVVREDDAHGGLRGNRTACRGHRRGPARRIQFSIESVARPAAVTRIVEGTPNRRCATNPRPSCSRAPSATIRLATLPTRVRFPATVVA
jgi:hypothetical protein